MANMYAVKARKKGKTRWEFYAGGNSTSYLRIYAQRYPTEEKAKEATEDMARSNPEFEFRVVLFSTTELQQ